MGKKTQKMCCISAITTIEMKRSFGMAVGLPLVLKREIGINDHIIAAIFTTWYHIFWWIWVRKVSTAYIYAKFQLKSIDPQSWVTLWSLLPKNQ